MKALPPPTDEPSRGDQLLPRVPRFWDYPQVWGAIGGLAMIGLVVFGYVVHHKPFEATDALAVIGVGTVSWAFGVARYYSVFKPPD